MLAKNRNDTDVDVAYLQYTQSRNKFKRLLRKTKRTFQGEIARQCKTNPKAFWSNTRRN